MSKKILVVGNFRQTITVVRSLARAGYSVAVGRRHNVKPFTEWSRYTSEIWQYQHGGRETFLDQLETYLKTQTKLPMLVFPVGELSIERLATAGPRFKDLAIFIMPDSEIALRCLDKRAIFKLTAELGIPLPPTAGSLNREIWTEKAAAFGYPMVVKRNTSFSSMFGEKALKIPTPDALKTFFVDIKGDSDPESVILQKWVPGNRHNCHFSAVDGRITTYFQQEVLRTDILDGSGYGVEGISVPPSAELLDYSQRLVGCLKYTGVGCVQFLVDSRDEKPYFLEINPRLDANCALPYQCGFDFPSLAVECAKIRAGLLKPTVESGSGLRLTYPAGHRAAWLLGDLFGWLHAVNHRKISNRQALVWLSRIGFSALRNRRHITWEAGDPLPTLSLLWSRLFSGFRNLGVVFRGRARGANRKLAK